MFESVSKFSFYDQLAYLLVGAVGVITAIVDAKYIFLLNPPSFDAGNFLLWLILTYFIGHIIQSIPFVLDKLKYVKSVVSDSKNEFNDYEKEVLKKVRAFFNSNTESFDKIWHIAYLYCLGNDKTGQISLFNSYYGLYRGWFIVSLFEFLFLLVLSIIGKSSVFTTFGLFVSGIIALLFYFRKKRFWNYMRTKVVDLFTIITKEQNGNT